MNYWILSYFITGAVVAFVAIIGAKANSLDKHGRTGDTRWGGVTLLVLIWPLALIAGIVEVAAEHIARKGS